MKHRLDVETIDILKRSRIDGKNLYLPEQLHPKVYAKVKKATEMLGGKWNRSAKAIVFEDDAGDAVDSAVMTGEIVDRKKLFQFFPTPIEIATRMVEMACIQQGDRILEPSAGRGGILDALDTTKFNIATPKYIHYCELDPKNAVHLNQNYAKANYCLSIGCDFMNLPADPKPEKQYDVILANPPFRGGQDVNHVIKMMDYLAKGGRLVTIMSPGFIYRQDTPFRQFGRIVEELGIHFEELEPGAFKSSGTDVRTVLLKYSKR